MADRRKLQTVGHAPAGRVERLESRTLLSGSWFVSPTGSDANPGTLAAPFQSIQHAANLAQAGDHVEIRAGTYRETVTPANSGSSDAPIVFEAYQGEKVVVSGADPVTGWAKESGNVYDASMPWTLDEGNDQIFVDGKMVNEARFPNTSLDVSHPTLAHAQKVTISGSSATLYDPALTQPAGYWNGAIIHITPGQEWIAQTGKVTKSSPGQLTFTFNPLDKYEIPTAGNDYYLVGTFKALDGPGEWFRDASGSLHLQTPAGDSPAGHLIEAKHRKYAFDLAGQSNITIKNISIFAATINTTAASVGTVLNHLDARYIGQFLALPNGWDIPRATGIVLSGPNSTLENSVIAYGAGDGVVVNGANSRVTNNVIHDVGYNAGDTAAIRVYGDGSQIDHNTIYNVGRSGILHQAGHLKILYNTIHDAGLQTTEAGGIYTVDTNGQGTEIAYNKISNMHAGGFGQTALFLDNNSNNFVVHNNQVWNVDHALKLNFTCRNDNIYNNTLDGTNYSVSTNNKGDWQGTKLTKNVLPNQTIFNDGATITGNVKAAAAGVGAGDFASGASSDVGTGDTTATPPAQTPPAPVKSPAPTPIPTPTPAPTPTPKPAPPPVSIPPVVTQPPPTTPTPPIQTPTTPTPTPTPTPPADTPTPPVSNPPSDPSSPPPPAPGDPATPVTDIPPSDYPMILAADKAAIAMAKASRKQHLRDLAATIKTDSAAYHAALRQLKTARRAARRSGQSQPAASADVAGISADINDLLSALQTDRAALTAARKSDFSGIASAKAALGDHQRAYRAARHSHA